MNGRSRPRTKVYGVNYDIGESYYKPALDQLDHKYSTRPSADNKPTLRSDSLPRDMFFERKPHLSSPRRSQEPEKHTVFDSRGARTFAGKPLSSFFEETRNFDDEMTSAINRIQANHKFNKYIDDIEMDSAINDITSKRLLSTTEKVLDSVGLNQKGIRKLFDEESTLKQGKITSANDLTKWTAVRGDATDDSSHSRLRATKSRLHELDDEMNAIADRQAYREQRLAHLKNLVSSFDNDNDMVDERPPLNSAMKSSKYHMTTDKKSVKF